MDIHDSPGRIVMRPASLGVGLPSISVIIAVRNGANTIQRALDSVFEQTHDRLDVVVMDGASTDGTQAILERNSDRIAYWESKPDRGVFHAWNKGLDHVTGEWICFLGADDRYHAPDMMARIAAALAHDDGEHLIAYGSLDVVRLDGSVDHSMGVPWAAARRRLRRRRMPIPHPATFHHRSLFERHGRFDERFRIAGDYEFLLRVLVEHEALWIPETVVDMAGGGLSDRPSTRYLLQREAYRARYMHGLEKAPPWRSVRLMRRLGRIWISDHFGPATMARVAGIGRVVRRTPKRRR
jgi:glycosyltransferase involved in cell wall biosynthesis